MKKSKKYGFKDEFEMLCLRHDYLSRIDDVDEGWIKEFTPIVHTTAKLMFEKLRPNFEKVGFDEDDIASLSNVYMISYMSLYSLRQHPQSMAKFIKNYVKTHGEEPDQSVIDTKERNRLIKFLRHKLSHTALICARKARNIVVDKDIHQYFAETSASTRVPPEVLVNEWKKFGYRKITKKEFSEIQEEAKVNNTSILIDKDGFHVVEVEIPSKPMSHIQYKTLFGSNDDEYHTDPEKYLTKLSDTKDLEVFKVHFRSLPLRKQRSILRRFIEKNKTHSYLSEEVSFARKMLRNKEIMV